MNRRRFLQNTGAALLSLPATSLFGTEAWRNALRNAAPEDENYWQIVRQSFPLTHDRIYFNTGGLGPSPYQVIEAVNRKKMELETICETGHSHHQKVREKVAAFVGAQPQEIAFTRNST